MASAAWTRKEGKSKSGGLNAKGRASYKGGTLKAPTKSKTSSRRKSFCARMGGIMGPVARRDNAAGYYPSDMGMQGGPMYKKGGKV